MILWELFVSFLQIGALSFGGGLAALPLIQAQIVDKHGWLTMTGLVDLVTIAEMTPGPIAINSATFVGIKVAGIPGALVATLGCITPACIIVSILAWVYFKYRNLTLLHGALEGLRPGIVAMIGSAGLSILVLALWGEGGFSLDLGAINLLSLICFIAGFVVLRKTKVSPILVMISCGVIGLLSQFIL